VILALIFTGFVSPYWWKQSLREVSGLDYDITMSQLLLIGLIAFAVFTVKDKYVYITLVCFDLYAQDYILHFGVLWDRTQPLEYLLLICQRHCELISSNEPLLTYL